MALNTTEKREQRTCNFCIDINKKSNRNNIFLEVYEKTALIADLSPLTIGHLLLIPLIHETSYANALASDSLIIYDIEECLNAVKMKEQNIIISEHGTGSFSAGTSACCEHAHLHIIPPQPSATFSDLTQRYIEHLGKPRKLDKLSNLIHFSSFSYLLLSDGMSNHFVWTHNDKTRSQFFRWSYNNCPTAKADYCWRTSFNRADAYKTKSKYQKEIS